MRRAYLLGIIFISVLLIASVPLHAEKIKVLLIDGQNNHNWKATTPVLKWILEDSGRFTVDVSTTPPSAPRGPKALKANATPEQKAAHDVEEQKWKQEKEETEKADAAEWSKWRPKFSNYAV